MHINPNIEIKMGGNIIENVPAPRHYYYCNN
jgi:hypothetical protein